MAAGAQCSYWSLDRRGLHLMAASRAQSMQFLAATEVRSIEALGGSTLETQSNRSLSMSNLLFDETQ
jgi:hypothetical protein